MYKVVVEDQRDIELIAKGRPYTMTGLAKNLVIAGMLIIAAGFILELRGIHVQGMAIGLLGIPVFMVGYIKGMCETARRIKDFIASAEKTGKLPPWPVKK